MMDWMHIEYILIYVVKDIYLLLSYSIAYFKLLSQNKYVDRDHMTRVWELEWDYSWAFQYCNCVYFSLY